MFGFLKKKLKESIDSITRAVSKNPAGELKKEDIETDLEEAGAEQQTEGNLIPEEKPADLELEIEKELDNPKKPEKEASEAKHAIEIEIAKEEKPKKDGFLERITKKFTKKLTEVTVKEEDLEGIVDGLKIGLMENDVALDVAEKICNDVEKKLVGKSITRSKIEETIKESLRKSVSGILSQEKINIVDFVKNQNKPALILFVGFNGAGKCVSGDTLIQMNDGQVVKIKELYDEYAKLGKESRILDGYTIKPSIKPRALSVNVHSLKIESAPVEMLWKLRKDTLLTVTLSNGQKIDVTPEHPFFVLKYKKIEKVRADNLRSDCFVMVPKLVTTKPAKMSYYHILEKIQDPRLFVYSSKFVTRAYSVLLKKYKSYRQAWKDLKPKISESTFCSWRTANMISSTLAIEICKRYPYLKKYLETSALSINNSHNKIILRSATEDLYKFMGLFYAEGYLSKRYAEFVNTDKNLINEFSKSLKSVFSINSVNITSDQRNTKVKIIRVANSTLVHFINKLMKIPYTSKSRSMYLPHYLLSESEEKIAQFIKWYWEGDGHLQKHGRVLEATTASTKFAQQVSMLLLRFGIIASMGLKKVNNKKFYRLYITGKDKILLFYEKIGIASPARRRLFLKLTNLPAQFEVSELIPNQALLFKYIRAKSGFSQVQLSDKLGMANSLISQYESAKYDVHIPNVNFQRLLDITGSEDEFAEKLVNADVRWIRVKSVIKASNKDNYVYDLTIPRTHNFVANNFIVHNTTTLAKTGNYLKNKGIGVVFAAGDSFRAASIEQLQVHGDRLGLKVIKHNYGADSAAVIFDAVKYATAHNIDVVLADTAGRTHVNANLMDELRKVCRVNKPAMKILVLDSLTGNDIVEQAGKFDEAVGVDSVVFTKADVYEKGGAILSAAHTIKKPILFLGVGQGYDDLEEFDSEKIVERLFG